MNIRIEPLREPEWTVIWDCDDDPECGYQRTFWSEADAHTFAGHNRGVIALFNMRDRHEPVTRIETNSNNAR